MAETKTKETEADVYKFISSFASTEQKKKDSYELIKILQDITGEEPRMWGPTIIGFGRYHYKYKSGHEGDAPILGFSPRKAAFSLYIYSDTEKSNSLLSKLGKYKMGKACIYVNKLADINIPVLKELCVESIKYISEHNECSCRKKYND
ncbi:DUF1801 domain-containing protein [Fulvivirga sp. RKSG066]|uniref:DUF1801 domain-containing protein n=1 Tax=Fulvivirga aurantia TaxID=2529383 RepID=UPI0012BD0CCA|nr:DUF1801 domain-containing protein [Fulvivirga aurantia]MTI20790.1 DUF1801 domain-containing protein [Fulvivirga aurantia]